MSSLPRCVSAALAFTYTLLPCQAQDDEGGGREIQDGPAIAYEDAFPGQEPFTQPLLVALHETDPGFAYVVCQPGHIYRVPRDGESADRDVFLDLSAQVLTDNWEEGLLGFQFDPDYANNHYVWTYWSGRIEPRKGAMAPGSRTCNRQSVIARYTVVEEAGEKAVDVASELRVMEVFQPFGNHNGGTILFGPDGMLYITFGDGGAANDPYCNSESLAMLLGKVLRIDVKGATEEAPYVIPQDNPFVGKDGARGEIWCYGVRNLWRMSFDRKTGELWAGEVGQNRIEEVVRIDKGGFYGWNSFEAHEEFKKRRGNTPTPDGHILPVASYSHKEGLSITGGHVYRGEKIPGLQGFFVYADFITKRAWACREGAGGEPDVVKIESAPFPPSSFAEEPEGELLMTIYNGKTGKVYRLIPASE